MLRWCLELRSPTNLRLVPRQTGLVLKFRLEVLCKPGNGVPKPSNFDEMLWIEAIYGGRAEIDAKSMSELSEDLRAEMEAPFTRFMASITNIIAIYSATHLQRLLTLSRSERLSHSSLIGVVTTNGFCAWVHNAFAKPKSIAVGFDMV